MSEFDKYDASMEWISSSEDDAGSKYTVIDYDTALAANEASILAENGPIPEFSNSNLARVTINGQNFGILTGNFPDYKMYYYSQQGALLWMQVENWLGEATTIWSIGIDVTVNQIYEFGGIVYQVIQAHTTQGDWTPPEVPALFRLMRAPGDAWVQPAGAHDAYQTGDVVTHTSSTWSSTEDANVWEPGVFGWVVM